MSAYATWSIQWNLFPFQHKKKSPKSSTCEVVAEDCLKLGSDNNACQSCKLGFVLFQERSGHSRFWQFPATDCRTRSRALGAARTSSTAYESRRFLSAAGDLIELLLNISSGFGGSHISPWVSADRYFKPNAECELMTIFSRLGFFFPPSFNSLWLFLLYFCLFF